MKRFPSWIFIAVIMVIGHNSHLSQYSRLWSGVLCVILLAAYSFLLNKHAPKVIQAWIDENRKKVIAKLLFFSFFSIVLLISVGTELSNGITLYSVIATLGDFCWYTLLQIFIVWKIDSLKNKMKSKGDNRKVSGYNWILYSLMLFCAWSIYLIGFYPGLMSYDSINQWTQALTFNFNDTHPVFHTLTIWAIMKVWATPAAVAIVQMIFQSIIVGIAIHCMEKWGLRRLLVWLVIIFYAFVPTYGMIGVSLWKDVPYSVSLLWLVVLLVKIIRSNGQWLQSKLNIITFVVVLLLVFMLRHNGMLPVVGVLIALVLMYKSLRKITVSIALSLILLVFFIKNPIYRSLDVTPSASGNLIWGIPLAQVASVVNEKSQLKITLQGNEPWEFQGDFQGYKLVSTNIPKSIDVSEAVSSTRRGKFTPVSGEFFGPDQSTLYNEMLYLTLSDKDTNWNEDIAPTPEQIQMYVKQHPILVQYKSLEVNRNAFDEKQLQLLDGLLPINQWTPQYYAYYNYVLLSPDYNANYLADNKNYFIKTWLKLSLSNPITALHSWAQASSLVWQINHPVGGYIYPFEWKIIDNELGLKTDPLADELNIFLVTKLQQSISKPWISLFWRPALFVLLALWATLVLKRRYGNKVLVLLTPLLLEACGLIATIPAQDTRYLYSFILLAPFVFALLFTRDSRERNN